MKGFKLIGLCLLMAMLLMTAACAEQVQFDEEALRADAVQVTDDLKTGDFAAVFARFDETMAAALPEDSLKSAWDSTVVSLGAFQEQDSITSSVMDGYYVVLVTDRYENNGLQTRVVYNTDGKISGMQFMYADLSEAEKSDLYDEVELTVAGDPDYPLGATLTLPAGVKQPPVVLLVQGSGASDRNENIYGNKPFADLAHGLAAQGIASLRYDKRYFIYPESAKVEGARVTLREEVLDDVDAAIALLQNDDHVDSNRIYLLGHSLGGMLIPAVASVHSELAGAISLAGSLRPLWEISYDQNREYIASLDMESLSADEQSVLTEQISQMEKDIAILLGDFSDQPDDVLLMGVPVQYWKSLDEYTGIKYIDQVTMPLLILQGSADFQIYPDKDYLLWQETLAGRDNVTFHLYDGLNHLFMPTQGKRDLSEYQTPGHVDQQVIDDIAAFILAK